MAICDQKRIKDLLEIPRVLTYHICKESEQSCKYEVFMKQAKNAIH